ncbi:MAG: dihydrodipicolinate synthase family protein [Thermomicrobiales bacterium]
MIPAHPLALTEARTLDAARQAALTRYYLAAGAGGVAVGVHTTQFTIREAGLYEPVLRIAAETVDSTPTPKPVLKIAGVVGPTAQARAEAELAASLGYDLVLLGLGGLNDWSEEALIAHVREIAAIRPVFGFYLQPSVGGRRLSYRFWREVAEIENVVAIKIAPFNRYWTLDVVRAVVDSSRRDEIALYTGNDDNIVADLLTPYRFTIDGETVEKRIVGGLLGHWAAWTERAVALLEACHAATASGDPNAIAGLLATGIRVTDSNAAFFDTDNDFLGCIAGIHEVLRRQGLMAGRWCLDPAEDVSPGQLDEIDRVYAAYPELNDDAFVARHLAEWLPNPAVGIPG